MTLLKSALFYFTSSAVFCLGVHMIFCSINTICILQYLMGDKPTEVDCTLFAFAALMKYAPLHPDDDDKEYGSKKLCQQYPTLSAYCDRIRNLYYQDWDRILRVQDLTALN